MLIYFVQNIQDEYYPNKNVANQNLQLDSMLEWIKMNTEKDAVFAGKCFCSHKK